MNNEISTQYFECPGGGDYAMVMEFLPYMQKENMPDDSKVMFEAETGGWFHLKRIDVRISLPENEQILIIPDPLIH